ncbi:FAD-dependent oxidoreductase [Entomomonas sp. E2T0]|uniref:FAD-dependent oxidoreductase n=1 Tax=Entomomonas sp. E2T0 TaxID=2930213 RepID=UPI0022284723|nr:FAD-dependent oxidoreductase [Entomomonas sp. E2T0]UYZ85210.1 FAD-dependent oxidoreductase [Entomomonas sp. E2T0]
MKTYDVLIIGGGVSGTALLYQLSRFTDLQAIGLLEKYPQVAAVNSKSCNNSQTIHQGDIETNYTLEKARVTKRTACMIVNYATKLPAEERDNIISKYPKMVLGVGKTECDSLRERFKTFKELYPNLKELGREGIAEIEPKIVEGRPESEEIYALGATDEYTACNYHTLSESFIKNAKKFSETKNQTCDVMLATPVTKIEKVGDIFQVHTENAGVMEAKYIVVAAGGHSLLFAHQMGYGKDFACLPMAGSYYFTPQLLQGKVYTVQNPNLPFAAVHGDPDVSVPGKTRFGPTALVLPVLERHNLKTFLDFWKVFSLSSGVMKALWKLLKVSDIRRYIFRNFMYEVPFLRERLFLKEIKKIIPTLEVKDITFARGFGGIRPQVIDKKQQKLMMGEAKINPGTGIVFNMTPSPGGTSCLGNAEKDMYLIANFLNCNIDKQAFEEELLSGEVELREIDRPSENSLAEV